MDHIRVGQPVTSRAGRDSGQTYVVVAVVNRNLVLLANGRERTVRKPKRKNVKHLVFHRLNPEMTRRLWQRGNLNDERIRDAIQYFEGMHKQGGEEVSNVNG